MIKPIDPRMIPPPLPPGQRPAEPLGENQFDAEIESQDERTRYMIAAILFGLLFFPLLFIVSFLASGGIRWDGDKLGSENASGQVEGFLDGESSRGDSLENGQDESTRIQAGEPDQQQPPDPGSEIQTDQPTIPGQEDESTSRTEPATNGDDELNLEQKTAMLSQVPNRQNAARNALSNALQTNGSGDRGSDLSSGKGVNPFVGEGKPAASTVFVIDVSGSMQRPNKLPRVMNALNRTVPFVPGTERSGPGRATNRSRRT